MNSLVELTKLNVRLQLDRLSVHPKVQAQLSAGAIELHGWYYQIDTGEVQAWQPAEDRWVAYRSLVTVSHLAALRRFRRWDMLETQTRPEAARDAARDATNLWG
jgi:hypothetical protein